jgi:hypothetical protein
MIRQSYHTTVLRHHVCMHVCVYVLLHHEPCGETSLGLGPALALALPSRSPSTPSWSLHSGISSLPLWSRI